MSVSETLVPLTLFMALMFRPIVAYSEGLPWPVSGHLRLPLIKVISPGRTSSFVYSVGVLSEWSKSKWHQSMSRESFQYLKLEPMWEQPVKCDGPVRPHGAIYTDNIVLEHTEAFRVSIPISFQLGGHFSPFKAGQVRQWPLIKISLLLLKKIPKAGKQKFRLTEIKKDFFTVQDLQNHASHNGAHADTETTFEVDFNDLLISSTIRLRKNANFRVKVEWAADNICDEDKFSLKLGDQIRVLRNPEGH